MATNFEKRFYKKILNAIDKEDKNEFYKEFNNAIRSGKMTLSQKRAKGQITFDDTWINVIASYLPYVDRIVRNPRLYMLAEENVMPIQSAKKINARSVQHLSSHVQNVQEIRDDGTIVPSKILSTTYEDTLNIYENRFIMTLIQKLAAFVEVRYEQVTGNIESYQQDNLEVNDKFTWRNYQVDAKIELHVKEQINDEMSRKNMELVEKIETIRKYVRGFLGSQFYQLMKESNARPVTPPILRTNIIIKSVDYSTCLKLWQFVDSYRQLGVEAGVFEKELELDENFIQDISDMILLNYSLVASNQDDRAKDNELKPYKYKKIRKPVNKDLLVVAEELDGIYDKESDPTISEYFYQRTKKNYRKEFTRMVNSGISYNKSFVSIYRKVMKVENGVSKEIIDGVQKSLKKKYPDRVAHDAKLDFLTKQRGMYKSMVMLKKQDLAKAEKKLASLEKEIAKNEKPKKDRKKTKKNRKVDS